MEAKRGVKEAFNCGWERGREGAQRKGRPREIAVVVDKWRRGCPRGSYRGTRKGIREGEEGARKEGWRGAAKRLKILSKKFSKKTE